MSGWGGDRQGCSGCTQLERENAELREQVVTLEAQLADAKGAASTPVVQDLFQYWQERTGHQRAKLDDKRRRKIAARLKDGYSPEEIRQAINGAAKFPYVTAAGRSATGRPNERFDDIELVCRDAVHLERFGRLGVGTVARNVESKLVGT